MSWGPEHRGALGMAVSPESPPCPPWSLSPLPPAIPGTVQGCGRSCLSGHLQSAAARAGRGFPQQRRPGLSGAGHRASAVPHGVSSTSAFEEPAAQDFKGPPCPVHVPRPPLAIAPFRTSCLASTYLLLVLGSCGQGELDRHLTIHQPCPWSDSSLCWNSGSQAEPGDVQ